MFARSPDERRTAIAADQWERYLALRDRLRSDAEARRTYSAAKHDLARRFPADRSAYTAGKALVIGDLLGD